MISLVGLVLINVLFRVFSGGSDSLISGSHCLIDDPFLPLRDRLRDFKCLGGCGPHKRFRSFFKLIDNFLLQLGGLCDTMGEFWPQGGSSSADNFGSSLKSDALLGELYLEGHSSLCGGLWLRSCALVLDGVALTGHTNHHRLFFLDLGGHLPETRGLSLTSDGIHLRFFLLSLLLKVFLIRCISLTGHTLHQGLLQFNLDSHPFAEGFLFHCHHCSWFEGRFLLFDLSCHLSEAGDLSLTGYGWHLRFIFLGLLLEVLEDSGVSLGGCSFK